MRKHNRYLTPLALTLILATATAGLVQAETVIKDQFGLKERVAGMPLNKMTTESGEATWQATTNVILAGEGDGGWIEVSDIMPFMGRVAIPASAKVITVEAKVRPVTEKGVNWIAVGIGNPRLGVPPWGKGICLRIDSAGNYGCAGDSNPEDFASKNVVPVKSGKAPEYNPDGMNRLKLTYNVKENSVSIWINGTEVAENLTLEGKDFKVDPAFAGFSGFFQKGKTRTVSDFTVTYSE